MTDYAFLNGESLLALCNKHGLSISEMMQRRESALTQSDGQQVRDQMRQVWGIMKNAVQKGLSGANVSLGGLVGGEGRKAVSTRVDAFGNKRKPRCGDGDGNRRGQRVDGTHRRRAHGGFVRRTARRFVRRQL